jgi:hypothetical protein
MKRSEVQALYFITPIKNLESIIEHGIMCFNSAKKLKAKSIADTDVQKRREKIIPGINKKLHSFANLYFNPRNPMMYKRKQLHEELCILCINPSILDLPDVIITDGNASSDYTRFESSPFGLKYLEPDSVFAEYWTSDNTYEYWQCKRRICAEVLVPNNVHTRFIIRILVSCAESQKRVKEILGGNKLSEVVTIKASLFFQ